MEFLRKFKGKNFASNFLHILFNAVFAGMVFLAMNVGGQVEFALLLILISKWRIFAVRARYWGVNILANLVDVTVGFSVVGLMYLASNIHGSGQFWVQAGLAVFYALWLIVFKPLSGARAARFQAGASLFLGSWVLMATAHSLAALPFLFEALLFVVGYGSARHVLSTYKEDQLFLLSAVFGLVVMEFGWLATHWTMGYNIYLSDAFKVPQAAIIILLIGLIFERFCASTRTGRSAWLSEYSAPILFSLITILVMLMYFSSAVSI